MRQLLLCVLIATISASCNAQERYTYKSGDPNGIDKWYMGRQIAWVMGHQGISWLERSEREQEENTSLLLQNLALKPGEVVADIGAGSGYHVVRMAPMVGPAGKVVAVDVQPEMISYLRNRLKKEKITNVDLVLGSDSSCRLPPGYIDKMLLVDVYHEFEYPWQMARSMLQALKPGGRLYLVEFRAEDPDVPIKEVHKMSEKQSRLELEAAGFRFVKNIANLPWQHCLVFERPG
jgi:ubiquinone/menaquinone biosynthesis C-methylase UbiE